MEKMLTRSRIIASERATPPSALGKVSTWPQSGQCDQFSSAVALLHLSKPERLGNREFTGVTNESRLTCAPNPHLRKRAL